VVIRAPQSRSGRCGEEKTLAPAKNSNPASSKLNAYAKSNKGMISHVHTTVTMKTAVFWDRMPCGMVDRYQRSTRTAFLFEEKE
jgi:hypothetical protein